MNSERLAFFDGIDAEIVRQINNAGSIQTFEPGQTVFEKGNTAGVLYILEQGDVDLSQNDQDKEGFNLNRPGEVFGWSSLAEKGIYASTATCRTKASIRCIPKSDIDPILAGNDKAAATIYRRLGEVLTKRMPRVVQ